MKNQSTSIMTPCTPAEFPAVLSFLDRCFKKPSKNWFFGHYAHIFQPTPESIRNHCLYKEDDRLAGIIGVYPFTLRIGSARLRVAGIGSVAVDPTLRGKGIMTAMLDDTLERIRCGAFDLSWLGGDRFRYKNYGWDLGGKQVLFTISRKNLDRYFPKIKPAGLAKATIRDIPLLQKLHAGFTTRIERKRADWTIQISRPNLCWRIARHNRENAYCVYFADTPGKITEIRGTGLAVIGLLKKYLLDHNRDTVTVAYPNTPDRQFRLLWNCADNFHTEHCSQIQIINQSAAWKKIVPEIARHGIAVTHLNAVVSSTDQRLILSRALGFCDAMPMFPARLRNFESIAPLDWWIADPDKV